MKKNKILLYLMLLFAILLCIPSIQYLLMNRTVDGFDAYYTYRLMKSNNQMIGLLSGCIVIGLILLFSLCYLFVIKKEKQIFQNKKQVFIWIACISFIFMLILPFLSSDIYYYIGDSWLSSQYHENPYYTSVTDLQKKGIYDKILDNTGYWKNTTSVYGSLWNGIARGLVSLSFGKVTIALFVFKLASYAVHLAIVALVYKMTKSTKCMLLYGLNPLVLIEFLSNVHNDIYLVFFTGLSFYFLLKQKNIYLTMISLAFSISIKYSTVLLVPFVLLYYFRKEKILKKIGYCFISGLAIVGMVVLLYLPYYRDVSIFTNMLAQGQKYSQSILTFLLLKADRKIFDLVNFFVMPVFVIVYVDMLINICFDKKLTWHKCMKIYNKEMLIFIFIVLSSFQKWYLLWILPSFIWQNKTMRKFTLLLTLTAILPSISYFRVEGDPYEIGMTYSIKMLLLAGILLMITYAKKICHKIKLERKI